MKKFFKNKKVFIITLVLAIGIAATAATVAVMTATTGSVHNFFSPADVNTHIEEDVDDQPVKPDTSIVKVPVVVNDGPSNAFIRARITISPSTSGVKLLAGEWSALTGADKVFTQSSEVFNGTAFLDNGNWIYCKEDGFYYYNLPVEARKEVAEDEAYDENKYKTASLFDAVVLSESADVTVYQESVLATDSYELGKTVDVEIIRGLFEKVNEQGINRE